MPTSRGTSTGPADVIVVGGGAVGICSALYLQRTGRAVTVLERSSPGDGASGHNGGALSVGDCAPIAMPGIVRSVPGMLRDPLSPFAVPAPRRVRRRDRRDRRDQEARPLTLRGRPPPRRAGPCAAVRR